MNTPPDSSVQPAARARGNRTRRVSTSAAVAADPHQQPGDTTTDTPASTSCPARTGDAASGTTIATNSVTVWVVDSDPMPQPRWARQFP